MMQRAPYHLLSSRVKVLRSIPLLDALKTFDGPIAEVHITNIHRRDPIYQHSLISLAATGVICGFGPQGYEMAIRAVARQAADAGPPAQAS